MSNPTIVVVALGVLGCTAYSIGRANPPQCTPADSSIDTALFNAHGPDWAGFGADNWRKWIADNFGVTGADWGGDGYPDLSNSRAPYAQMANADFLLTFGLFQDSSFTFHDPVTDYLFLGENHADRFKDDVFHAINTGDGSVIAKYDHVPGASPSVIIEYCGQFGVNSDPASRMGIKLHENWHGWQWRYHWHITNGTGHLPIGYDLTFKRDLCKITDGCDYFTQHRESLFSPGQMEYSTTGPPDQEMHSPNQISVEFWCDFSQRPASWVPVSVIMAAQMSIKMWLGSRFLNPPVFGCGDMRPF